MKVNIDKTSGFCFGVSSAIQKAEEELEKSGQLFCLGALVHNNIEMERLEKKGLKIIDHNIFKNLKNCKVLIRAHGEPPETYEIAKANNIELIDATCKVVLKIQERILKKFNANSNIQIVIFGKRYHPEVIGLLGQTQGRAIVVQSFEDLTNIDFSKPISLFSQTTMNLEKFEIMVEEIKHRMKHEFNSENIPLEINDTVCRQVSNRSNLLKPFVKENDVIIFVSGKESSNGRALFEECLKINPNSYFVSSVEDINTNWFNGANTVGVCGATSTPVWLINKVADYLSKL